MKNIKTDSTTRTLGVEQGYLPLYVTDTFVDHDGSKYPVMETRWALSEEEFYRLKNSGEIRLFVLGTVHPPVKIEV